jgi:hypothetical protein
VFAIQITITTMPIQHSPEQINHAPLSYPSIFLLVLASGLLFCGVHIFNSWALYSIEISEHISLIYLPAFLRLMNVLVLGMLWGTLGTALGGALLFFWLQDSLLMSCLNTLVSAGGAALSVWLMRLLLGRALSLSRLSDLFQLSLLYALLNALLHHLIWSLFDPPMLVSPNQLIYMVMGDINGAILGALGLRWLARNTRLVDLARQKANPSDV